jgi:hypothetical protein
MRKAIFGLVVVGLLVWAAQFMKSSQTDTADAVVPVPAAGQESGLIIEPTAAPSAETSLSGAAGSLESQTEPVIIPEPEEPAAAAAPAAPSAPAPSSTALAAPATTAPASTTPAGSAQ